MLQNISQQSTLETSYSQQIKSALDGLNQSFATRDLASQTTLGQLYQETALIYQALEYWMLPGLNSISGYEYSIKNNTDDLESLLQSILRELQTNTPAATPASSFQDILAANPWWATNSDFALAYPNYSKVFPDDGRTDNAVYSFPQLMSLWSSRLSVKDAAPSKADMQSSWYNRFGIPEMSANASVARRNQLSYTWFDWMADFQRSNLVFREFLETYSSPAEAIAYQAVEDAAATTELDNMSSNSPVALQDLEIERPSDLTGYTEISDAFQDIIDEVKPQRTSGNAVLTVIPSFSVGGINVQQKTFDFSVGNAIVPYCRAVASFIWAVMAGCMIFRLLSQEWAFYTSLGRSVE